MANAQTAEFIKMVTANGEQLAKAGNYKVVWFCQKKEGMGGKGGGLLLVLVCVCMG